MPGSDQSGLSIYSKSNSPRQKIVLEPIPARGYSLPGTSKRDLMLPT